MLSHIKDIAQERTITTYVVGTSAMILLYLIGTIFYNLFLHPLRSYPGPKTWAFSQIPLSIVWISGSAHKKFLKLHQKYGEVVRVAPNQLSFSYPEAWEQVMGHRKNGQEENGKDPDFWRHDDKFTLVGSNRERHSRLRKILSNAFSAKAMVDQQATFNHYGSLLIDRLTNVVGEGKSVEIIQWFNWTTFDMAGDLIFGESFGCLAESSYHPWVDLLFKHIKGIAVSASIIRFPFPELIIKILTPKKLAKEAEEHQQFVRAQVKKRMAYAPDRPDFMEAMIRAHDKDQVSDRELVANAHNLIVGSSETTATTLAGATYLLASHRPILNKMHAELVQTFKNEDEINLVSVQKLEYMFAVLHESLRVFPPVPSAIPRRAPKGGSIIHGRWVPPNTILEVWQWPLYYNPIYFKNPESFVPERWLGDPEYDGDQKAACQPFAVGPRNCIGKNLAYAEMRLILARLVWNFDIHLDPRSEGWLDKNKLYFLWEKAPLYVKLTPRWKQ